MMNAIEKVAAIFFFLLFLVCLVTLVNLDCDRPFNYTFGLR